MVTPYAGLLAALVTCLTLVYLGVKVEKLLNLFDF
jgi:hypothetical protein